MKLALDCKIYSWHLYSRKLKRYIQAPDLVGSLDESAGNRLVVGEYGSVEEGNFLRLYLHVSLDDGVIHKARFLAYGQSALIGAAEGACELMLGKNYDQAGRISADLIDSHLRDQKDQPAFPEETYAHLNYVIFAIDDAVEKCDDIPFADSYVATPIDNFEGMEQREFPGWKELSKVQKLAVLSEVIEKEVKPFVELDAGGVKVVDVDETDKVTIAYEGNCTSCYSAIGGTLDAINKILKTRVSPSITVMPDMTSLSL